MVANWRILFSEVWDGVERGANTKIRRSKYKMTYVRPYNWRASVASETLTGVTQSKIGDVCLFIYMDVRMSFCTLTLAFLC